MHTYESFSQEQNVSPVILYLTELLAHLVGTLCHMMWPLGAENVPDWLPSFVEQKRQERERVKAMANLVARIPGVPITLAPQPPADRMRSRKTPASPSRGHAKAEKQRYKKRRRLLVEATTAATKTAKPGDPIVAVQKKAETTKADSLDWTEIEALSAEAEAIFAAIAANGMLRRRVTDSGAVATHPAGANGLRAPSIQQFMTECGQMAVHNALAMTPGAGHADTDAALFALGPMNNDIHEEDIRAMLAQAGHPGIPVLGNLAEMQMLIGHLRAGDAQVLANFGQGPTHQAGLMTLDAFMTGATNVPRLVVNTAGHPGAEHQGYHWIAVELTRVPPAGPGAAPQIHITYRDSLPYDTDCAHFFAALRGALG